MQAWITDASVKLDDQPATVKQKVWGGERVEVAAQPLASETPYSAEEIALDIIYEDEALLVVNKTSGLVVHPGSGNWAGTMLNALLHHAPSLSSIPRAGIVHRLDKDTSGLLVVAKTLSAQTALVRQLQARSVKREYLAIVQGRVDHDAKVDAPIGRHPVTRTKMAIVQNGKPALTHYKLLECFAGHSLIQCSLETGRTHQIRVHMQSIGHALVGDPVYGAKPKLLAQPLRDAIHTLGRQALHATRLGLIHPLTQQAMQWEKEMPEDMQQLLSVLRSNES